MSSETITFENSSELATSGTADVGSVSWTLVANNGPSSGFKVSANFPIGTLCAENVVGGMEGSTTDFEIQLSNAVNNASFQVRTDDLQTITINAYLYNGVSLVETKSSINVTDSYQTVTFNSINEGDIIKFDTSSNSSLPIQVDNFEYDSVIGGGGDPYIYPIKGKLYALHKH